MNSRKPHFSVVIPTFNSEKFIEKTLQSVLQQTYQNFEVILSDDGSSDQTLEVIKRIISENPEKKIHLLENNHNGPGENRNIGVRAAKNEWIAFLDSDDLWFPEKLEKVVEKINQDNLLNIICHSEVMQEDDKETILYHYQKHNSNLHLFISLLRSNSLSPSATVLKRELFLEVGGFTVDLPSAQDFELWLKLAATDKLNLSFIKEALGIYVIRGGSISSNPMKRLKCVLMIKDFHKNNIQRFSSNPLFERMRYIGIAYSVCGRQLLLKKQYVLGLLYILKGMFFFPRLDWIGKSFKQVLKRT